MAELRIVLPNHFKTSRYRASHISIWILIMKDDVRMLLLNYEMSVARKVLDQRNVTTGIDKRKLLCIIRVQCWNIKNFVFVVPMIDIEKAWIARNRRKKGSNEG